MTLQSLTMGSKEATFTFMGTPHGVGSFLVKNIFDPCLTIFWPQNNPFAGRLGI